jgi:hypothetical protein
LEEVGSAQEKVGSWQLPVGSPDSPDSWGVSNKMKSKSITKNEESDSK